MYFKAKVKNRRIELGLTMEDIAKLVGVSTPTIQRYESSEIKNIKRDKIKLLADALKITPANLMDWDEPMSIDNSNLRFDNPTEALRFILEQPVLMAYGGYDLDLMTDDEIITLANDILLTIKISTERRKNK